ncbi:uncharacterized protein [Haliotis cracherodii]|uniref:uncharacterized protein n=1 Tax=Haliotis cracherodii TaxID=6455 RepID=UPI0039E8712D
MNEHRDPATAPTKDEWPELLHKLGVDARDAIRQDNPDLEVFVLPADSFVTEDFRRSRVRIFVQVDGTVASIPRIG